MCVCGHVSMCAADGLDGQLSATEPSEIEFQVKIDANTAEGWVWVET